MLLERGEDKAELQRQLTHMRLFLNNRNAVWTGVVVFDTRCFERRTIQNPKQSLPGRRSPQRKAKSKVSSAYTLRL